MEATKVQKTLHAPQDHEHQKKIEELQKELFDVKEDLEMQTNMVTTFTTKYMTIRELQDVKKTSTTIKHQCNDIQCSYLQGCSMFVFVSFNCNDVLIISFRWQLLRRYTMNDTIKKIGINEQAKCTQKQGMNHFKKSLSTPKKVGNHTTQICQANGKPFCFSVIFTHSRPYRSRRMNGKYALVSYKFS